MIGKVSESSDPGVVEVYSLPGGNDEDHTERSATNEAFETWLVCILEANVGKRLLCDGQHVPSTVQETANFSCTLGDWAVVMNDATVSSQAMKVSGSMRTGPFGE